MPDITDNNSNGDTRAEQYCRLAADLESQELKAVNGEVNPSVYAQLLAIYLFQGDLPNAKLLWKRIPSSVKQSSTELENIWKVGQYMWLKDYQKLYAALNGSFPDNVKGIMHDLAERTRKNAQALVAKAYSTITASDLSVFLGVSESLIPEKAQELGWSFDATTKVVTPCKPSTARDDVCASEDQLSKLTDFISFLEQAN